MKSNYFKLSKGILFLCCLLVLFSCGKQGNKPLKTVEISDNWQFRQAKKDEWLPAKVPGNVHMDLLSNKKIEDPFYRTNEKDQQWIEMEDWEYQTTFNVDKGTLEYNNVDLVFEGLDTYADVYVNDTLVLKADNMFNGWTLNSKKYLKEGENKLRIYFTSPITKTLPQYEALGYVLPANNDQAEKRVSVFTRKAGYHYGWDWGPRFVTSGIWRPIHLKAWDGAKINNIQVIQQSLTDEKAVVTGNFEIEASSEVQAKVAFKGDGFTSQEKEVKLNKGINNVSLDIEISNPERWWPSGLGKAKLYNLNGELKVDGTTVDTISERIGLRTVEVVNEKDSIGESFYFKVNGASVFMKGANYIPSDNFLNRVDKAKYEMLLNAAVNANMNMVRVWGGGIYENEMFYDLADEKGLLVWQDFMFGCSMYPGDTTTLRRITQEAAYNVKRLRNHPSVAFWCGNNEMDEAWHTWGWQKALGHTPKDSAEIWHAYEKIFHNILPEAVKKYDNRFYWSSSPKIGFRDPKSLTVGDMHYWGVWHEAKPFSEFKNYIGRFMSEFGFQSFPEMKTIKSYTLEADWNIDSTVMKSHQRHPRGNALIREYMARDYKMPQQFESFIYAQQVLQAEGMKMALEAHRRKMPYNMGTLYWQLDDCWPVASWSSMDYYGRWKAMHYFVKKAFDQVLVSPTEDKGITSVWVVSDRLSPIKGSLGMKIVDFSGKVLWEKDSAVTVPANSSNAFFTQPSSKLLKGMNIKNAVLVTNFKEGDKILSENVLYFTAPKNLQLPVATVNKKVSKGEVGYVLEISSDKLAKNVYLRADASEGFFSDNYFDLLPGQTKVVNYLPKGGAENFEKDLKIVSLVDAK